MPPWSMFSFLLARFGASRWAMNQIRTHALSAHAAIYLFMQLQPVACLVVSNLFRISCLWRSSDFAADPAVLVVAADFAILPRVARLNQTSSHGVASPAGRLASSRCCLLFQSACPGHEKDKSVTQPSFPSSRLQAWGSTSLRTAGNGQGDHDACPWSVSQECKHASDMVGSHFR